MTANIGTPNQVAAVPEPDAGAATALVAAEVVEDALEAESLAAPEEVPSEALVVGAAVVLTGAEPLASPDVLGLLPPSRKSVTYQPEPLS